MGALTGVLGSLAALETIRALVPFGEDSAGKLLIVDLMSLRFRTRSEEHTSELQSLMRISYAVFCLKKKQKIPRPILPNPSLVRTNVVSASIYYHIRSYT